MHPGRPESAPASVSCEGQTLAVGRCTAGGVLRQVPPASGCATTSPPTSAPDPESAPPLPDVVDDESPQEAAARSRTSGAIRGSLMPLRSVHPSRHAKPQETWGSAMPHCAAGDFPFQWLDRFRGAGSGDGRDAHVYTEVPP